MHSILMYFDWGEHPLNGAERNEESISKGSQSVNI